jgi:hypothetical protein
MSKRCFVIGPIGPEGSEIRRRADQMLRYVITPAASHFGYVVTRADQISEPGVITSQIIQRILEDPLVIADLSGQNPNVFYELALRHAIRRPVVQIISADERLPFDVAATRTIFVDHRDLDSVEQAREAIIRQVQAVQENPEEVDSPISIAVRMQRLAESNNPAEQTSAAILAAIQDLQVGVRDLRRMASPALVHELALLVSQLWRIIPAYDAKPVTDAQLAELRGHLRALAPVLRVLCIDAGLPTPPFAKPHTEEDDHEI